MSEKTFNEKDIFKHKKVVELSLLSGDISTEAGFRGAVLALCPSQKLPKLFPDVPVVFNKLDTQGITMNDEFKKGLLTFSPELYDSKTYENRLDIRGPMEEILIAYERERIRCGMTTNKIFGDSWSSSFIDRFKKLKPKIGRKERSLVYELNKENIARNPKGSKIA